MKKEILSVLQNQVINKKKELCRAVITTVIGLTCKPLLLQLSEQNMGPPEDISFKRCKIEYYAGIFIIVVGGVFSFAVLLNLKKLKKISQNKSQI